MSQNGITLPPILITPDPPLPKPSMPKPGVQVIARPLPWNGKIPENSQIDAFFSQKGIRSDRFTMSVVMTVAVAQRNIEQSYTAYLPQLPADIDAEISAAVGPDMLSALEKAQTEKAVVESLITQSIAELAKRNAAGNAFFGRNLLAVPIKKNAVHFVNIFQTKLKRGAPLAVYKSWEASAEAAYGAKILEEKIRILSVKSTVLAQAVATAQAEENVRLSAEAEAKRLASEAEAQLAIEKAAEQVRLAAEAEAKRVANELAKKAAEAHAQHLAQQQAARQAIFTAASTVAMPANANAFSVAGLGLIQVGEGAASLAQAIAEGVAALGRIALAGPGAYIATFLSLALYSSSTADDSQDRTPESIRYGLGTVADQLGLPPDTDLQSIALAQGTVDMPMRLVNQTRADQFVISVINTGGVNVPKAVPVHAATLNPATGLYEVIVPSTITDQPPITLTWTPVDTPLSENPSSTTPAVSQEIPLYTGVTLQPITIEAETYPGVLPTPHDLITWFPASSGIKPVYVMLSSPYKGATIKGKHSGRMYNPDKAGGPPLDLNWTTASITQEGIDLVKLHVGRFEQSDANTVMIDRLESILRGETSITDVDKRFYTHELRELERYRALGVIDGVKGDVWNDAHTATLEDYKVNESHHPLYTDAANAAGDKQDYNSALKEK